MTQRISFVSDLHLFARRSEAPRYAEAIRTAARRSAVLVLGGDIFDFSWSTLPTVEDTVEAAFHWLQHLAAEHPHCQIHYLLGNHDYCQPFLELPGAARAAAFRTSPGTTSICGWDRMSSYTATPWRRERRPTRSC